MAKGVKTGGRKPGSVNLNSPDVKALARKYTHLCIEALANIVTKSKSEINRSIAAEKLLDRGWGKPTQSLGTEDDKPLNLKITWEK